VGQSIGIVSIDGANWVTRSWPHSYVSGKLPSKLGEASSVDAFSGTLFVIGDSLGSPVLVWDELSAFVRAGGGGKARLLGGPSSRSLK